MATVATVKGRLARVGTKTQDLSERFGRRATSRGEVAAPSDDQV